MKALLRKIRQILRDRRTRRFLTRFVSGVAAIVVFVTTYALVLPAITMENEAACGIEAHQHDDSCYSEELICGQEESEGHHHTEDCYTVTKELECQIQEHQHSLENGCFDEEGNLVCEQEEHTHSDSCYKEHRELTCGLEESEGHHHTDSCYEKVLTCGKEVHTHSAACYKTDLKIESAAVASTGVTSAAAVPDLFNEDIYSEDSDHSQNDSATNEALAEQELTDTDAEQADDGLTSEDNSDDETKDDTVADIRNDEKDKGSNAEEEEDASSFSTGFAADEAAENGDAYIPEKDALDFNTVLNHRTGIYYHHVKEDEADQDSSVITEWAKADEDTELNSEDLIRMYLSYTLPKDTINATNDISRYRLPDALRLTDEQINAINTCENGISAQYINHDALEITDPDRHAAYLGLESVEGTRCPDEELKEDSQEFISAVVRAEKIYDEETGEYAGTDLVFTFSPYTVEKNAHAYDKKGQPTKAGEEVTGWLTLDFNMGQIEWAEDNTSEIIFAEEDKENDISEIKTVLRQADPADAETDDSAANGATEAAAEYATEEAAAAATTAETAAENNTADATAEAATAATTSETAAESTSEQTDAKNDSENEKDNKEESAAANYPAAVFDDSITVRSGHLDTDLADTNLPRKTKMTVHVEADEGTFPKGTKMVLSAVEDLDAVAEAVGTAVDSKTRGFQAVDITFYDKDPAEEDAKEIEPLKPIRVSIKSDEIKKAAEDATTAPVVVHIEDDNTATEIENTASKTDSAAIEIEKPGVEAEMAVPENDSKNNANEEKEADDAAQVNEEKAGESSTKDHNADKERDETDSSDSNKDNVDAGLENEESQTDNTDADSTKASSVDSTDAQEDHPDNNIEAGEEDKADADIIETKDAQAENTDPAADNSADGVTGMNDDTTDDAVNFEADSFSIYAVVYTVDFHWEVDGRTYVIRMPGGGFVSFEKLMEVLGAAGGDEQDEDLPAADAADDAAEAQPADSLTLDDVEVSEETKRFVSEVQNVEFSNPENVWVGKVEESITVGKLKEENGLDVQYSAELTEDEINTINGTMVGSGDWALISLQPFVTNEALTVTMKDGEVFTIRVTDDQAGDPLGLNGETFVITALQITYHSNGVESGRSYPASLKGNTYQHSIQTESISVYNSNPESQWTFEFDEEAFDGAGGYYIYVTVNDIRYYFNVTNGQMALTTEILPEGEEPQEGTLYATPLNIKYSTETLSYRISAVADGNSAYLTYENGSFQIIDTISEKNQLAFRNPLGPSDKPGRIGTWDIKSDGIMLKLFDYEGYNSSGQNIDSQYGPDNLSTLRNGWGINDNRTLLFSGGGINNAANNEYWNKWTGDKPNGARFYSGEARQDIVKYNLGSDGFPVLKNVVQGTTDVSENGSLKYLFDDNGFYDHTVKAKTAYLGDTDANGNNGLKGLLRKDDQGYYYYDSEQNYAYLDPATGNKEIVLYSDTFRKGTSSRDVKTEKIGFFPFNDYNKNNTEEQGPKNNLAYNHQFGMYMGTDFVYPKDGIVPETNKPMTFEFSGDDDVWVFIDGVLVLDLGGVHQPISGKIDFSDGGKVSITEFGSDGYEYISSKSTTIDEMFKKASLEATNGANDSLYKFNRDDFSKHKIDFFYIERGGCDSNCKIKFNLLLMTTLTLGKQVNGLTPSEREKYQNDEFNYELGIKHNDSGVKLHDNTDSYWANTSGWRTGFEVYETKDKQHVNEHDNFTIRTLKNGTQSNGEPISDGSFTLKDGEKLTVTHVPKSDLFYTAEKVTGVLNQFETPHAERLYRTDASPDVQEEEITLHMSRSNGGGGVNDWETRAYKSGDTNEMTYTNTIREKNLTVRKIWEDHADHSNDSVQFRLLATVDGEKYETVTGHNEINAQRTMKEGSTHTTTTYTEDVYKSGDGVKYTLNAANDWTIDFEHLPAMTDNATGEGKEIIYSVEEIIPDGFEYSVTYTQPADTGDLYLDLYKFWPDGNANHDGHTETDINGNDVVKKVENIYTYVRRSDGMYLKASRDTNGEYVYSGVTEDKTQAAQFLLTSKTQLSGMHTQDQHEMFDYAARINRVPSTNGAEEEPVTYTYELVQETDNDPNTKGLVMFARPRQETEIHNKKGYIQAEKKWLDEKGNKLNDHPESIQYSVYRLRHDHEWAKLTNPEEVLHSDAEPVWDYDTPVSDGWYTIREPKMVEGEAVDGLEMRVCRFASCGHYTETREKPFEPCVEHQYGDWVVTTAPTCLETGVETRTCLNCGAKETRTAKALGHNYVETVITPLDCEVDGVSKYTCSRCNDTYTEVKEHPGHKWPEEWIQDGNKKYRICENNPAHRQEVEIANHYPGADDLYLWDMEDVWPVWQQSGDNWQNEEKTIRHSGIFQYNGKYYVIYGDGKQNYNQWPSSPEDYENWIVEVKGSVKNASDVYGNKTWIETDQVPKGTILRGTDGNYYVRLRTEDWSGPPPEQMGHWYKIPDYDSSVVQANGLHSMSPYGAGKTLNNGLLRADNEEYASRLEGPAQNRSDGHGPVRTAPPDTDLTEAQLLAALNLTGLGVKNPDTGDTLTKYLANQTLATVDGGSTLVEDEDNLWRQGHDVPIYDENGSEYRYYIVEDVPTPGEELDGNRYETTYSGQSNGLTDEGVTRITNILQRTGSLKITKNVTINNEAVGDDTKPSLADDTYTFTVTKKGDSSFEPLTVTVTITNGKASTEEVTDLDPGIYIVKENARDNHTTLTLINNAATTSDQAEVEVVAGKVADTAPVVSFTNNLVNANIRVIKVKKDTETPVPGAKFSLTRVDAENRVITGNEAYSQEKTAGSDGTLEFTGLWNGRYKLEETFTPDGYIKREGPYYITIDQAGMGTLDTTLEYTMISPETGNEYTIENEPGAALPNTGGPGTRLFTIFGMILIAGAGLLLLRRRRTI